MLSIFIWMLVRNRTLIPLFLMYVFNLICNYTVFSVELVYAFSTKLA